MSKSKKRAKRVTKRPIAISWDAMVKRPGVYKPDNSDLDLSRLIVLERYFGGENVVLWSMGGTAIPADNSWKDYAFIKVADVELKVVPKE